jgi:transposase
MKQTIRYSEAFKMEIVREMSAQGFNCHQVGEKYGIRGAETVKRWAGQYGNGLVGKIIRVETTKEVDEFKKLKERVKRLEALLADTNLDLALERQFSRLACERAGILDVEEFKRKAAGKQRTER